MRFAARLGRFSPRGALLVVVAFTALAVTAGAQAAPYNLNDGSDFSLLSHRGYTHHSTSTQYTGTGTGTFANDANGSNRNDYSWGAAAFNGSFFAGTARDVLCYLSPSDPPEEGCPNPTTLPTTDQQAEIWKYTPATGGNPLRGTWVRAYKSPQVTLQAGTARDVGYRSMKVCSVPSTAAPRLFVTAFGAGGRILYSNDGVTFSLASQVGFGDGGFGNTVLQLQAGTADLGFRGMECWANQLFVAPTGRTQDPDAPGVASFDADLPYHPVIYANTNPTSTSSTWRVVLNTRTTLPTGGVNGGVADDDNDGAFDMAVFNGNLYVGVWNRQTGFEVWRTTATCPTTGVCSWTRILDNGGGRSEDAAPDTTPAKSSGTSAMKVFNGSLYIGVSDAAAVNPNSAEIVRVNADDTWELIMGEPRQRADIVQTSAGSAYGNPVGKFKCNGTVIDDSDGSTGWCSPVSGLYQGFGTDPGSAYGGTATQANGRDRYVWRLEVYEDRLYAGTLDSSRGGNSRTTTSTADAGFDLWRSGASNGDSWSAVDLNGFGNNNNYGVRSLVTVPGNSTAGFTNWGPNPSLMVGSANPYADSASGFGGAEMYIGTCGDGFPKVSVTYSSSARSTLDLLNVPAAATSSSPAMDLAFDVTSTDTSDDGTATINLNGSATPTLCDDNGLPANAYQWFGGAQTAFADAAGRCTGTPTPSLGAASDSPALTLTRATNSTYTDYAFTLRVRDFDGDYGCRVYWVRASNELAPTATISPAPTCGPVPYPTCAGPAGSNFGGGTPELRYLETDGPVTLNSAFDPDGAGALGTSKYGFVKVTGTCAAGSPGAALEAAPDGCAWTIGNSGGGGGGSGGDGTGRPAVLGTAADCGGSLNADEICVGIPVFSGSQTTSRSQNSVQLTATDLNGFAATATLRIRIGPFTPPPASNVSVISVTPASTPAAAGVTQTVTVTIKNNGTNAVGGSTLGLALTDSVSADNPAAAATATGTCRTLADLNTNGLTAGAQTCIEFDWAPVNTGSHTLTAALKQSDNSTAWSDSTSSDNTKASSAITVNAASHDVELVSVSAATSPAAFNTAQGVAVKVRNNGNFTETNIAVSLADNLSATIARSSPSTTPQITSLAPGASVTVYFSWTPTARGDHTLTASFPAPAGDTTVNESATTLVSVPNAPAASTSLVAALSATRTATLTWVDNASNETRFELQRCNVASCTYSSVSTTIAADTTSYVNTLTTAATYRWRLRACNVGGCSAYVVSNNLIVP